MPNVKCFMKYSKNFKGIARNKYDSSKWNTKGIIDVKEQIWFTNVKYLKLSALYGHYMHACIFSKVICINAENKVCLPNKEYISVH